MKYYEFIFYNFYSFCLRIGRNDQPEFKAMIFLSTWTIVYITAIMFILGEYVEGMRSYDASYDEVIGVGTAIFIMGANYFLFLRKKKYKEIKRKFDEILLVSKWKSRLAMTVFLMLPFAIFAYILFFTNIIK